MRTDAGTDTGTNTPSRQSRGRWLLTSSLASLASMVVLAWQGRRRHGSSAALINAPSHWVYGDKALRANAPSLKFTLLGAAIHHASALFWAMLYEGILRALPVKSGQGEQTCEDTPSAKAAGASTPSKISLVTAASALTTAAWLVDTRLVPSRLTPGFERRSSRTGLAVTYGAFAAGLALGALAARRRAAQQAAILQHDAEPA